MTEVVQPQVRYWAPEPRPLREQCVAASVELTSRPDLEVTESEDVFRIHEAGLDWDLGVRVYQLADPAKIATGADGRTAWPMAMEQGMKEAMRRHFGGWLAAPLRAGPADGATRSARHGRAARQT